MESRLCPTAHMHHTHLILKEEHVPLSDFNIEVFNKVPRESVETDNVKSLVSQYNNIRDAPR
jgi:hypothetical protein